jgi:hypothetical protein
MPKTKAEVEQTIKEVQDLHLNDLYSSYRVYWYKNWEALLALLALLAPIFPYWRHFSSFSRNIKITKKRITNVHVSFDYTSKANLEILT